MGQHRLEFPPEWRYCVHKRWVIVYEVATEGIEILRVLDASRDFGRIFRED